ncbi:unnamed protein product [Haemonchus placei]|uniref:Uncharacterized protein n=1 Tax=Haemonchus placei TaxID=6290 RepID=A0A0N4X006_HAEPC|nr:unnamed protein product [Haemonchus placei]
MDHPMSTRPSLLFDTTIPLVNGPCSFFLYRVSSASFICEMFKGKPAFVEIIQLTTRLSPASTVTVAIGVAPVTTVIHGLIGPAPAPVKHSPVA